jgi:hypothetical protein
LRKTPMKDVLLFKRMLIPYIIPIIFWLALLACLLLAVVDLYRGLIMQGVGMIIIGPILIRAVCEYMIVLFKINDSLTEIKHLKQK